MGASLIAFATDNVVTLSLAALLYLLPGLALLVWLLPPGERPWEEWLGLAAGVSVALYPVLILITHLLHVTFGTSAVVGLLVVSSLSFIWRARRWRLTRLSFTPSAGFWPGLLVAGALLLVVAQRLYVVRDLPTPLWGDGYQHTLITQLLVDNGGLFSSWEPYAPLTTFTYHFGFHASAAVYHWLSGAGPVKATLVVGQLVNALAILTLAPLANRVAQTRWAGPVVVMIAGLWSSMPLYYVNWGRYTQLAGQVILPAAMWLTLELGAREKRHIGLGLLLVLVTAGLALTHYRVVLFFMAFVALWLIFVAVQYRQDWSRLRGVWLRMGIAGGAALALAWPWIQVTLRGNLPEIARALLVVRPNDFIGGAYNAIGNLTFFAPNGLVTLALVGAAWGGVRRQPNVLLIAVWVGLLFGLSNPDKLGLPGTGIVNNFAVLIALYIPLGILAACLLGKLAEWVVARYFPARYALCIGGLALAVVGARSHLAVLDVLTFQLVTPNDLRAMEWIRREVPADATFLVNSFPTSGNSSVVGSDAGWWLPLLARRRSTLPPLPYVSEKASNPNYREQVNQFHAKAWDTDLTSAEGATWLLANHVTHIYVGEKAGTVGNTTGIALSAQALEASPFYRLIYEADQVYIFKVLP